MNNCKEFFLDSIVKIEVYKTSAVGLPVPAQVPGLVSMTNVTFGTALLSMDSSGTAEIDMAENPTLKITSKRQAFGQLYTHELDVTPLSGFNALDSAINSISKCDFHILYTTQGGEQYLSVALPNCSAVTTSDNVGKARDKSYKFSVSSLSGIVRVVNNTENS